MKEWGVDHIRIPFTLIFYDKNSETFIEKDLSVSIKFLFGAKDIVWMLY